MTNYPYLYYTNYALVGVCVNKCPNVANTIDPAVTIGGAGVVTATGSTSDYGITMDTTAYLAYAGSCDGTPTDFDCFNPSSSYIKKVRSDEERSEELIRTRALGNTTYNASLKSS